MKLSVLAVGRLKAGPERLLAEDYKSRIEEIGPKAGIMRFSVADTAESRGQTAAARVKEELQFFTSALPPRAFTIVLDERGKPLASLAFADLLRRHINGGTAELAFLIGGPDGHAPPTREMSGLLLSLGPMTWPHRLARVMLFEQIYRAVTIMVNHPYHRP
ncbi:MAG: 23S rRNA (pseudouridine(1915)-N(3))-methyltransferase RlmH [Rhizobiales bacterium]|nr:23S rRNA (pseudouridine(1915)-N(3))-methyltransferase RlmH [Hyphomicrobiales bacterium]